MAIEKTQSLENQIQKPSINDRLRKDNIQNRDAQTLINHFLKIGKQDWNTAEQQLQNWVKTLPSENRLRKFLEKEDRALNKLVGSRKAGLEKLVSALKWEINTDTNKALKQAQARTVRQILSDFWENRVVLEKSRPLTLKQKFEKFTGSFSFSLNKWQAKRLNLKKLIPPKFQGKKEFYLETDRAEWNVVFVVDDWRFFDKKTREVKTIPQWMRDNTRAGIFEGINQISEIRKQKNPNIVMNKEVVKKIDLPDEMRKKYQTMNGVDFNAILKLYNGQTWKIRREMGFKKPWKTGIFEENINFLNEKPLECEKTYMELINEVAQNSVKRFELEISVDKIKTLTIAMLFHESRWDPLAISSRYCLGIAQLGSYMYKGGKNGAEFRQQPINPFNPQEAIPRAVDFITYLWKKYRGNKKLIMQAYNAGEPTLDKALRNGGKNYENIGVLTNENIKYPIGVKQKYNQLKRKNTFLPENF